MNPSMSAAGHQAQPEASERPLKKAEKRIGAAFDELYMAMKRLESTFEPVLKPQPPHGKEEEKPCSATHIEILFDKIVSTLQSTTVSIHDICDRSAV